ncbi:hypothetical protein L6164_026076 [Bauhinia variegata]|uniref:Uncharacterized protein n=1 Tax=Bauhinia variegata TaxID=167791 RepID=A0ACB9M4J0_BAUVA|nr:hypothetical protein L6164_026076 [Bauhinia variegata]
MEVHRQMANEKSRILIFGGTGYIGKYMVKASIALGHPTFIYSRPLNAGTSPSKIQLCQEFTSMGATFIHGELEYDQIVAAIKKVDIVISTLACPQVLDQLKIIDAIKVAGNIKRFLPSEFGSQVDTIKPLPPFQAILDKKIAIRRATEEAGIPYTYVCANCCSAYFVNFLLHPNDDAREIVVYGNGKTKAILNYEEDIALYTIKVANDPRTCDRIVVYRPQKNFISQNELISLWERKTGRNFNKKSVSEEEIVKLLEILPSPENIPLSIIHSVFIKGDLVNFELGENQDEVSKLYPDHKYKSIDELLDIFLVDPPPPASAAFG